MTVPRDPDAILAAWLDEGPDRPPRADAAGDRRRTPEPPRHDGGRSGCRGGTRHEHRSQVAAGRSAVAIAIALGGAAYLLAPGGRARSAVRRAPTPTATAQPTPSKSAAPSPTPPIARPSPSSVDPRDRWLRLSRYVHPSVRIAPLPFTIGSGASSTTATPGRSDVPRQHRCQPAGWVDLEFGLPRIDLDASGRPGRRPGTTVGSSLRRLPAADRQQADLHRRRAQNRRRHRGGLPAGSVRSPDARQALIRVGGRITCDAVGTSDFGHRRTAHVGRSTRSSTRMLARCTCSLGAARHSAMPRSVLSA